VKIVERLYLFIYFGHIHSFVKKVANALFDIYIYIYIYIYIFFFFFFFFLTNLFFGSLLPLGGLKRPPKPPSGRVGPDWNN
jgi:hypothetical protein